MVRLQPGPAREPSGQPAGSPSHYGSTATMSPKGRAKWLRNVSIPLWFDCNIIAEGAREMAKARLHPTMVRLQRCEGWLERATTKMSPSHYGSTATRLREDPSLSFSTSPSHYGSTATQRSSQSYPTSPLSPSHYGSTATPGGYNR